MRIVLALVFACFSLTAHAAEEIYRWVDKAGVIHYSAQPPTKDAKPATLPTIQTYSSRAANKAVPALRGDSPAKAVPGSVREVRILAPAEDEIFRDPQGVIKVSAAVLPTLPDGMGVIFYLDGAAKNTKPSAITSTTFTGVERGEHTVTVAVVDAAGKELKRAAPVSFYTKPPTAK